MEAIAPGIVLFTCDEDISVEFEHSDLSFHIVDTGSRRLAYWLVGREVLGWVPIANA